MVQPKPPWLKKNGQGQPLSLLSGPQSTKTASALKGTNTICKSARCPNIQECFSQGTATFLILGNRCTRCCAFCAVDSTTPYPVDRTEPERIASAVQTLGLKYVVITSVTRDDLADGGAEVFCQVMAEIRKKAPGCSIELLIPDFKGEISPLELILSHRPAVVGHNLETVRRLYPVVRPQADYQQSLTLLKWMKLAYSDLIVKSGIMIGMGETKDEIINLLYDLKNSGCDIVTIGQYLQPGRENIEVSKYIHPDIFEQLKKTGESLGLSHVEAGPLVRSSYHAQEYTSQEKFMK